MVENREVLARNLQHYMDKNNVKAADICDALGFKQNTFSDWVNAKTYPRIDALEKLANYFHINKAHLVEDIVDLDFITPDEMQLLMEYRKADASTQESIRRLLDYQKIIRKE